MLNSPMRPGQAEITGTPENENAETTPEITFIFREPAILVRRDSFPTGVEESTCDSLLSS